MAGQLDGSLAGRPVKLVADDQSLTLITNNLSSLLKLRPTWVMMYHSLQTFFERERIKLYIQIGWLGKVRVFPAPNYLVRFLIN